VALTGTSGPVAAGAYDAAVDVSSLADGNYLVSADATDTFGNLVSATQTAPTVAVVRDTTVPVVLIVSPQGTIDPATVADEDAGTPGYQATVELRLTDVHAAGGELCLTAGGVDQGCKTIAVGRDNATWPGVTFPIGATALVAAGSDFCGLAVAPVSATVTLVSAPPTVAITDPAADTLTIDTSATIVATVLAADGVTPLSGATVTLRAGAIDTGLTPTDNGDGTYTFTAVPLIGGANVFTAQATADTGTATSGPSPAVDSAMAMAVALFLPLHTKATAMCSA